MRMDIQHSQLRKRGRPPKRPEDTLETRELLLRAGLEVLTEKGFAATGIDEVLKRVGVPKVPSITTSIARKLSGLR